MNKEHAAYIDHEVRIQLLESILKETRYLIRALLGTAATAIVLPVILHHLGWV